MVESTSGELQTELQPNSNGGAKKPRGKPFPKGAAANPHGRRGKPVAAPPGDDGQVTPAKMRKVLGQPRKADAGPTEKELRRWLSKDPKGYSEAIDRKAKAEREADGVLADLAAARAEVTRLKSRVADLEESLADRDAPEADEGTDRALAKIEAILKEAAGGAD